LFFLTRNILKIDPNISKAIPIIKIRAEVCSPVFGNFLVFYVLFSLDVSLAFDELSLSIVDPSSLGLEPLGIL